MDHKAETASSIYSSGYDLWVFSRRSAHLKNDITWALNLQPLLMEREFMSFDAKSFEHLAQTARFEMDPLIIETKKNAPLLIDSRDLLPVPRVVIINDRTAQEFHEDLETIMLQFKVPQVRVFLPPDSHESRAKLSVKDSTKNSHIQWVLNNESF